MFAVVGVPEKEYRMVFAVPSAGFEDELIPDTVEGFHVKLTLILLLALLFEPVKLKLRAVPTVPDTFPGLEIPQAPAYTSVDCRKKDIIINSKARNRE